MSKKLQYLKQKKLNTADELRALLTVLENRQPSIKRLDSTQALLILRELDLAHDMFVQFSAKGVDLLPEQGRFEMVKGYYRQAAPKLLKALGGAAALSDHRPQPSPPREKWWWYIHELVAARQQRTLRRAVSMVALVLFSLGGLVLAFNTILAPDPVVVARFEAERTAFNAVDDGDYERALEVVQRNIAEVSSDPGMLLLQGMIHDLLGQKREATAAFNAAQADLDEYTFHIARSQLYLRAFEGAKAEEYARQALELQPEAARGWLLVAQSLERQERDFEAMLAYEKAGTLALDSGENEIVVMARMALGRLGPSDLYQGQ